jgi:phage gp16-like protein
MSRMPPDIAELEDRIAARLERAASLEAQSAALSAGAGGPGGARGDAARAQDRYSEARSLRYACEADQKTLADRMAQRKAGLAKIAMARKALGVPEDAYRTAVWRLTNGRSRSAADMTAAERAALLSEYERAGWRPTKPQGTALRVGQPPRTKAAVTDWVKALLADAGRSDAYADAIARKSFAVERWEWLPWDDLCRLGQMLQIDARRRAKRANPANPVGAASGRDDAGAEVSP